MKAPDSPLDSALPEWTGRPGRMALPNAAAAQIRRIEGDSLRLYVVVTARGRSAREAVDLDIVRRAAAGEGRAGRSSMFGTMVATPHMLVGAAVALKAPSVKGGVAIGILSHLALDAVPHSDYRLGALGGLVLAADLAGGALAVCKLSDGSDVVLAGALGGVLPDILRFAEGVLNVKIARRVHDPIHANSDPPLWGGIATQCLSVTTAALVLRTATRRGQRVQGSSR